MGSRIESLQQCTSPKIYVIEIITHAHPRLLHSQGAPVVADRAGNSSDSLHWFNFNLSLIRLSTCCDRFVTNRSTPNMLTGQSTHETLLRASFWPRLPQLAAHKSRGQVFQGPIPENIRRCMDSKPRCFMESAHAGRKVCDLFLGQETSTA